jgi:NAD(P)-dependent dehydrogenase (short-subunit alcohol dehydrogenase family)
MKNLNGKVAVITGAASGIGRAIAETFAGQGMKIVLADVEAAPLEEAARALRAKGAEAIGVPTDVVSADSVAALAERARDAFGRIHVLCNNAGVFVGGLCWKQPLSDYEWVLGVNTWGVIHGIRTFVPILIEQGEEAHIVNTASMAAVTSAPFSGLYTMSKHAVLALSECLYQELRATNSKIGVSCLCPEAVATGIGQSSRNRPQELAGDSEPAPEAEMVEEALRATVDAGLPPQAMADRVLDAILSDRFYILGEGNWMDAAAARMADIRAGRNPGFTTPEQLGTDEKILASERPYPPDTGRNQ